MRRGKTTRERMELFMKKLIALIFVAMLLVCAACAEEAPALSGGWAPSESPEITEEMQSLFDKGMEGLLGVNYVPVAYLGSQVVAGTNHCFLAQATVVVPDAQPFYALIYLYEKLDGTVEILHITPFDFGALCEYGPVE